MTRTDWSRPALEAAGFVGWVPFGDLPVTDVPPDPGVYIVWRPSRRKPRFRRRSVGGLWRRHDPTVAVERLALEWVPGAEVLYIGGALSRKADPAALSRRLNEYLKFGRRVGVTHSAGRLIWQLADYRKLLVAWRVTGPEDPEDVEAAMLDDFASVYGALPFANLKRGRRRAG